MVFFQIEIRDTLEKGRGIFAQEQIDAEQTIESAPVIVMSAADRLHLDQTLLHDYIFEWNPEVSGECCMALGNVPIYNHSYASNAEYFMDYESKTISIQSVRKIEEGEEILINYNGDWNDEEPLWFDVKE